MAGLTTRTETPRLAPRESFYLTLRKTIGGCRPLTVFATPRARPLRATDLLARDAAGWRQTAEGSGGATRADSVEPDVLISISDFATTAGSVSFL